MNYDPTADGLARVQSESHIPASTWRQWCVSLDMDPSIAIELWDEICHPLMLASGKAPDVALILQLRASRPGIYVDDFREELPAVLLSTWPVHLELLPHPQPRRRGRSALGRHQ